VIKGIRLRSKRFDFETEITAKVLKRRYRIYEVPIYYAGRDYADGKKITWREGFAAIWASSASASLTNTTATDCE
jgi:hypothetical protein